MSFIHWLVLGVVAYASGFCLRYYHFKDKLPNKNTVLILTASCFAIACCVFLALNFWVLKKALDIVFVGVSSAVATFIFYYGLTTDNSNNMNVPD